MGWDGLILKGAVAALVSLVSLGVEGVFSFLFNSTNVVHGHTVPAGSFFAVWPLPAKYLNNNNPEDAAKRLPDDGIR